MDLSKDESEKIHNEEDMLKGDINKMRLANSYEGLELNYMIAKDRIENIYKVACDHLHDKYDNEVEKKLKEEEEPDELEEMLRDLWNATVEDMRNEKFEEPKKEVESQESKDDWYDIPSDEMVLTTQNVPSVMPQPKTGLWIKEEKEFIVPSKFYPIQEIVSTCSICNAHYTGMHEDFKYCPNCGAKMEVEV